MVSVMLDGGEGVRGGMGCGGAMAWTEQLAAPVYTMASSKEGSSSTGEMILEVAECTTPRGGLQMMGLLRSATGKRTCQRLDEEHRRVRGGSGSQESSKDEAELAKM